ncbi:hypothetical protein ARD30_11205 [Bosea thiooxidans]|uniref:Aromatic amino acid beta-eliminating lyase/threonine aldolase domain-containing protein n=1 Tax=Bosea thiooxidans TaxID=53254 RepID=A0A0Q3M5J7_9HYPH|nr:beta-eliminating lyase-related protein [Bosea thiooxidans]KQK31033.1 hypothetical protein ARD30_11205 [Bosea thiooxidans]
MIPDLDRNFRSDNNAGIAPEIVDALLAENARKDDGYGRDALTAKLDAVWSEVFETAVHVVPVVSGTAANAIALAMIAPSHGVIFAHKHSHILADEVNAPGFLNPGITIAPIDGTHGFVTPDNLAAAVSPRRALSVNRPRPAALSITQCTEVGTAYDVSQLAQLQAVADENGLAIHMGGARFANAVAYFGCSPAELTWKVGVKVLSLGAAKNGCLNTEAIVLFDEEDKQRWWYRVKQSGGLVSKLRFNSAQLLAYAKSDLWLHNASHANARARQLVELLAASEIKPLHPVQGNEVFLKLSGATVERLRRDGYAFHWDEASGSARFVTAFDTSEEAVDALVDNLTKHTRALAGVSD